MIQLNQIPFTMHFHQEEEEIYESFFTLPIEQFLRVKSDFSSILMPFSGECALEESVLHDERFHCGDGQWGGCLPTLDLCVWWSEGKLFSNNLSLLNLAMKRS